MYISDSENARPVVGQKIAPHLYQHWSRSNFKINQKKKAKAKKNSDEEDDDEVDKNDQLQAFTAQLANGERHLLDKHTYT